MKEQFARPVNNRQLPSVDEQIENLPLPRRAPHSTEAEQALLSAIIVDNDALDGVSSFLTPAHFFHPLHARIYEMMVTLISAGRLASRETMMPFFENDEPIDANTSVPKYLYNLSANVVTIINAAEYGRTIYDLATRRAQIVAAEDLLNNAYAPSADLTAHQCLAQHEAVIARLRNTMPHTDGLIEFAEDAAIDSETDDIIAGVVPRGAVGFLHGPSGLGKTFVALYIVAAIANGAPVFGRRTLQAAGLYIPLEGGGRFGRRLRAAHDSQMFPQKRVARLMQPITLGRVDAANQSVAIVTEASRQLEAAGGLPVGMIIIDTLARALAGDNENEAAAVSAVMSQAARIAQETGAAVLIVHHPGKDSDRGMRGSSSLYADADFVLRIDGEKTVPEKTLTLEKSKDDEEGVLGHFSLHRVVIGKDHHGDEITSMVVARA